MIIPYRNIGCKVKKKISLLLSILMLSCLTLSVSAKEQTEGSLSDCSINISGSSSGVEIVFITDSTTQADEIGCKDIVLQEKVNGVWRDIKIADSHITKDSHFGGSATYTNAVKGATYKVHCTHYATWGSKTQTLYNESSTFVYN